MILNVPLKTLHLEQKQMSWPPKGTFCPVKLKIVYSRSPYGAIQQRPKRAWPQRGPRPVAVGTDY